MTRQTNQTPLCVNLPTLAMNTINIYFRFKQLLSSWDSWSNFLLHMFLFLLRTRVYFVFCTSHVILRSILYTCCTLEERNDSFDGKV